MKTLAAAGLAALVIAVPTLAKFRITVSASDTTPARGERVTLLVRSERALDYNLRLIAVAPGQPIFKVVATITGDTSHPDPKVAQHGFEIHLTRIASDRWRGIARFREKGTWLVVVPNGGAQGVILPAGAARRALAVH